MKRQNMENWLIDTPVAHRGLHDLKQGIPENSMSAFSAAMKKGYAIELDVHLTSDGSVVVFHDHDMSRLTDQSGTLSRFTMEDLSHIGLSGSRFGDVIPSLGEVMTFVDGQVPLLIELKNQSRNVGPLEKAVTALIEKYNGPCAVQSFNPWSMGWFAVHAPTIIRGQISYDYRDNKKLSFIRKWALKNLLFNRISRPHFVAYDVGSLPSIAVKLCRMWGLPTLSWTVKTDTDRIKALKHVDNIIFESISP